MTDSKAPAIRRHALSPTQVYEIAVSRHRAGRLDEAEKLYRAVLQVAPDHFGATHYLGLACTQKGSLDEARALLQRAVADQPTSAEARTNLGITLAALQHPDEAIAQYEAAIALQPDHVEARNNLGIVLQGQKRHAEALAQFEMVLVSRPTNPFVRNNLGNALAAMERHAEAIEAYRQAIAHDPRFAEAFNNLGLSLAVLGRLDEAVASYEKAVALKPDYAEAHGNFGAALLKLERYEPALSHLETALDLDPRLPEVLIDLGNALAASGRETDAELPYRRALAIDPYLVAAHGNLGNLLVILRRRREAIPHFKAALDLDPEAFETRVSLAGALSYADRHDEAIAEYRTILSLRPESAEPHKWLGSALEAAGRSEEAIVSHQAALTIDPKFAGAQNALAFSLVSLGRLTEARAAVETAISLAPRRMEFYGTLGMAGRFKLGDPHLATLEEMGGDLDALSEDDRISLHYTLGRAYTDTGRSAHAVPHLIAGSAIRRSQLAYDEAITLQRLDRIQTVFTPELLHRKGGHGDNDETPIFIVGMPRSGSTLVEQILASHPMVYGAGEVGYFGDAVRALMGRGTDTAFADKVIDLASSCFGELGARYVASLRGAASGPAQKITDKALGNYRFIGLIHLALPRARIIHTRRDPVDTCLSAFERQFGKDHQPFTYDLGELGRYFRAYAGLMDHWHDVLPPDTILDVHYEDVVADLEAQARRILAYCDLDWDERCLTFHRTERSVFTASASQVRQPIYKSSVGKWEDARHLLRPLLDVLGIDA